MEANTNREHLRAIIEQKLDQNTSRQAEALKGLRGTSLPRTSAGTSSIGKIAVITAARVSDESRCSNIARCYHN
ncbi:MAG: hypothetical protein WBZ51_02640, partial [Xanthobacteraceae bacterium]